MKGGKAIAGTDQGAKMSVEVFIKRLLDAIGNHPAAFLEQPRRELSASLAALFDNSAEVRGRGHRRTDRESKQFGPYRIECDACQIETA